MAHGFPAEFRWGTATASYQIEGAPAEAGKGESIWDRFSHIPGNVAGGDTGDVACDHYHRVDEDVALMSDLGINTYSFSIGWPRVFPDGTKAGGLNEAGLEWYRELARKVSEAGITPMATLYHWDLPQALQDRGGWANPEIVGHYEHYARTMFEALGEWVPLWVSHTEPWVVAWVGHWLGRHAPGIHDFSTAIRVSHHLLLSHGRAKAALAQIDPKAKLGIKLNTQMTYPAADSTADSAEDTAAAYRDYGYYTRWFLDPLLKGDYPADMVEWYRSKGLVAPEVTDEDREVFANGIDFLGHSYYMSHRLRHTPNENWPLDYATELVGEHHTEMGWRIWPQGLYDNLVRITNDYGKIPIIITENGVAFNDIPTETGAVHDPNRIEFIRQHLAAARAAMNEGVNLQGYIYWSLMDNFEWALGYSKRFGLTYVDYATQKRTPKDSFAWYRSVIRGEAEV